VISPPDMESVAPRYGEANLTDVIPGALAVLGVPGPDPLHLSDDLAGVRRVAVLLIDGLGWHQLPLARPYAPNLAELSAGPHARELTAAFPSTTPTSLASLGTGAAPGAHGLVGFTVNVPGTDRVLVHIDWADEPDPMRWQPLETQFERAAAAGVPVSVVSRPEFAGSGLSRAAYRGAVYHPADGVDALAERMLAAIRDSAPSLVYGYHPDLDRIGHLSGVDSPDWRRAVADVDRIIGRVVNGLPADAALLVTADHGQLNVPPDKRLDLHRDPRLSAGIAVVAGEPRVRYLHTVPGARDDVLAAWRAVLGSAAWIGTREETVAAGWFGPVPPAHLPRIGDVVVICNDAYAVLASRAEPELVSRLQAYHGSYTRIEMAVPLLRHRASA
jgi:Type I phosphodiesterase / nucleotide pyrophosphatase